MNTQPRHPKCRALPVELHPDIQFLPLYHGGGENQRFFCLWSFMWSKLLLCRFQQLGQNQQTPVLQGFAAFRLSLSRIPTRHSQSRRATNCATPGYGAPYAFLAVGFTIITQNWEVRKSILPQNYLLNLKCWVNFAIIIGESAKVHQLKTKKGEIIMLSGILEHVAKILGWTNDGYEQNIILAIAQWLGNKGL